MDFVSHGLWGGIAFGRRSRRVFLVAAGISLLPDVLTEGLFAALYLMNIGGMPGWEHGHPNITAYPLWAQILYNAAHSLVVFTLGFLLIWALVRKPVWIAGAWGLHILIDIPTHSMELFPTPFLWPLSELRVDGVDWSNPIVLGVNVILLGAAYWLWLRNRKRNDEVSGQ
ncbi:MAG: hypothetical protein FJZ88_04445 [Chloroflexi bacterium]|nr:hypothetical protein [Chloroflexota bacterium]